jgi:hypothetical protein
VTALDDPASELIDPNFDRPLRPVALVAQLAFTAPPEPEPEEFDLLDQPTTAAPEPEPAPEPTPAPAPAARQRSGKRVKPTVPAWEDVLLGVRSSGDR